MRSLAQDKTKLEATLEAWKADQDNKMQQILDKHQVDIREVKRRLSAKHQAELRDVRTKARESASAIEDRKAVGMSLSERHKKAMQDLHKKLDESRRKVAQLEQELLSADSAAEAERSKHRTALAKFRQRALDLTDKVGKLAKHLQQVEGEKRALHDAEAALASENKRLQRAVADVTSGKAAAEASAAALQERVGRLELETKALSADKERGREQVAKANGKLGATRKALHDAKRELNACRKAKSEQDDEHAQQVAALEEENAAYTRAVGELNEDLAQSMDEVTKLKADLARKEDEARSEAEAHEACSRSLEDAKLELAEKDKELVRAKEEAGARAQQFAESEEKLEAKEKVLGEARAQLEAAEAKLKEAGEELARARDEQRRAQSNLRVSTNELRSQRKEFDKNLAAQRKKSTTELAALRKEMNKAVATHKSEAARFQKSTKALDKRLKEAQADAESYYLPRLDKLRLRCKASWKERARVSQDWKCVASSVESIAQVVHHCRARDGVNSSGERPAFLSSPLLTQMVDGVFSLLNASKAFDPWMERLFSERGLASQNGLQATAQTNANAHPTPAHPPAHADLPTPREDAAAAAAVPAAPFLSSTVVEGVHIEESSEPFPRPTVNYGDYALCGLLRKRFRAFTATATTATPARPQARGSSRRKRSSSVAASKRVVEGTPSLSSSAKPKVQKRAREKQRGTTRVQPRKRRSRSFRELKEQQQQQQPQLLPRGDGKASNGSAAATTDRARGVDDKLREGSSPVGESQWAQCDNCRKWRMLAVDTDPETLPFKWYCWMNSWDPHHSKCTQPEDPSHWEDVIRDGGVGMGMGIGRESPAASSKHGRRRRRKKAAASEQPIQGIIPIGVPINEALPSAEPV
mmetsp:Transcript_37895/g.72868  ORF Transcript_37895/g.72868 Transcript_37895/m.72868 type:complete len:874 (+) Transcript_37895:139-2760(+)|eukprot:CAMPEP_0167783376 /NCGR_PEP_ID=MMETSP0111_2-20121227/7035_1 /TAXON_ID=91324 /ORGANISM="Lotharella globosa, Strain CCCM811" /LENGTH=873 /DNA_ID=CAMNT_0007674305 /DNA_START=106 /DNA_END=2727 /DNA_ORIENTATION=-